MAELDLIYSQQSGDFLKGRAYANPRFYSGPRQGVAKVFIVGNWPQIEEDYKALGVPVERLDPEAAVQDRAAASKDAKALLAPQAEDPGSVIIPDDWRSLPYTGGPDQLTLRQLAALVSATPVKNKGEAKAALEAELRRRAVETPQEAAGGLSLREVHADLEAAGVEFDPADPADTIAKHAELKAG